jgi:2-oxoglutarate dehydrogenase E2 component (dihydrolipoamide succinyltransferase)
MARFEVKLPKLGESVLEATVINWLKKEGDTVKIDDGLLEVATDKVDTEIPCEIDGIVVEIFIKENEVAKIGQTLAIIETDSSIENAAVTNINSTITKEPIIEPTKIEDNFTISTTLETQFEQAKSELNYPIENDKFLSPLVKNIVYKEGISEAELSEIKGTGLHGRITKDDILNFLPNRLKHQIVNNNPSPSDTYTSQNVLTDEIIPISRMGKLIAEHMTMSKQTSAHVQSFIEIDVTSIVNWRNENKDSFLAKTGEKLTFTPIFLLAVAKCILEYPMLNISFDGEKIIKKKDINLGMATALPDGNLIVPVIKNAERLNLSGMAKKVNQLAEDARKNKLSPDDIQGGTYTVTNVGSFGSITGTPIINQPQVAILALGAIRKMPSVIESPEGDMIGIRHKMIVAHSYDHRVINGALGGKFILKLKEILENFDTTVF